MPEQSRSAKAELLADIERDWNALHRALDQLNETQMTTIHDAHGWTGKDHLIHLTAWERSVVFFLQGKPRHLGIGVDESVYQRGDDDEINAVVHRQTKNLPLRDALAQLRDVHQQLLKLLEPLTDADLQKPYRHYLPDEPGEGDGPLALNFIYGDSANHYREHLEWIEALVAKN